MTRYSKIRSDGLGFRPGKLPFFLAVAVAAFLAGCESPTRTITYKDGKLSMTEVRRHGEPPAWWELKEVSSKAEVKALRKDGWKPADGTLGNSVVHQAGQPDQFLVKRPRLPPTTAAKTPAFRPMLMTAFGTNTSADGKWRIGVTETSLQFTHLVLHNEADGLTWSTSTTTAPGGWAAHPNWCVFLENQTRAWSYDGDHQLLLHTCSANGANCGQGPYDPSYPFAVPPQVLARLSKPVLSALHRSVTNSLSSHHELQK